MVKDSNEMSKGKEGLKRVVKKNICHDCSFSFSFLSFMFACYFVFTCSLLYGFRRES